MFPAKVSLKFVVISPPTTIVALETFLILFLKNTTGVIAIAMMPTPMIASFQELYKRTLTSPTIPKIVIIKVLIVFIIFLEAVSGSVKNLVKTRPEEFIS